MKKHPITSPAIAAIPLLIGGSIYVLWRSTSLLMFRWFDGVGLTPIIRDARHVAAGTKPHLVGWLLYSLPDAMWAACGVFVFATIWSGSRHPVRHFWVLLAPALAIGGEFAQYLHLIPGTFDFVDVTVCTLVSAVSLIFANRFFCYDFRFSKAEHI